MTLRELPNTVVHCKTREEYDRLMRIYEDGGWKWCNGGEPPTKWDGWKEDQETYHCYQCCDGFARESKGHAERRTLTLTEFLRKQGLDTLRPEDLKPGDWVEVVEEFSECGRVFKIGSKWPVSKRFFRATELRIETQDEDHYWPIEEPNQSKFRKCDPPTTADRYQIPADAVKVGTRITFSVAGKVVPVENVTLQYSPRPTSLPSPSMPVQIGHLYRPKPEARCGVFEARGGDHIRITSIQDGELRYDILNARGSTVDECFYCFDSSDLIPFSSSPSLIMKAIEAGREAIEYVRLGADDKLLRECGYKDSCGKWTPLAKDIFIDELLREDGEKVLLPLAKEIKKATEKKDK